MEMRDSLDFSNVDQEIKLVPIEQFDYELYKKLQKAIDERFPNAQFVISCFKTIEEIENKMLTNQHLKILFVDSYEVWKITKTGKFKQIETIDDYYVVEKKPEKDGIYYCDVIDELINRNLTRKCDHRFLEKICLYKEKKINMQSLDSYCGSWGS